MEKKTSHIFRAKIRWFRSRLRKWFRSENQRNFLWRKERTPYKVLVSEMMLRRTRADQVEPVFRRFIKKYPDMQSLTKAKTASVRKELKSLGLEWRIDNFVDMVKETQSKYGNEIPSTRETLLQLPGVGAYVANTVLCFGFGKSYPIIDTNVVRLIGRFFGLPLHGEARRRRNMIQLVDDCLPNNNVAEYNYALLDFAAKICTARNPDCLNCPLRISCCFNSATKVR